MSAVEPELDIDFDRTLSAVQGSIDRETGPVAWARSLPTPIRVSLVSGAIVAGSVAAVSLADNGYLIWEAGTGLRPLVLAGYLALLAWLVVRALRPMQRIESPSESRITSVLGVLIPFAAAAIPLHESHEIPGKSGYCVILGFALAGLLVVLFKVLDRGAHTNRRTALLGVAAGAMASNLALEFHCPITRAAHKLAFHASVGALLALGYLAVFARRAAKTAAARALTARSGPRAER